MIAPQRSAVIVMLSYLALMAGVVAALVMARGKIIEHDGPESMGSWQQWKRETEREAQAASAGSLASPVARRAVTTDEPPLLTLMRDYFPAVAVTCVASASVLYGFLALAVRGVWCRRLSDREPETEP